MATTPKTLNELSNVTTWAGTDRVLIFGNGYENDLTLSDFVIALGDYIATNYASVNIPYLDGSDKIPVALLPTGTVGTDKGSFDPTGPTPNLTDGTGVAGDRYDVIAPGSHDAGSGSVTYAVGDVAKYDGAIYYKVPGVANIFNGSSTEDQAAAAGDFYRKGAVDDRHLSKAPANGVTFLANGYAIQASSLDSGTLKDNFTLILSVRLGSPPTSNPAILAMLVVTGTTASTSVGDISYQTDGTIDVSHYDGSSDVIADILGGAAEVGRVYRIAYRFESGGTDLEIFVDGVSKGTITSGAGITNLLRWQFGASDRDQSMVELLEAVPYNLALTDAEIALDAKRPGIVPKKYQWGGTQGGVWTADFSGDSVDGVTANAGAVSATATVDGDTDNIQFTCNAGNSGSRFLQKAGVFVAGKKYRLTDYEYFIPSGQSHVDGIRFTANAQVISQQDSPTLGSWQALPTVEFVASETGDLRIRPQDGGELTFDDTGGDDTLAIRGGKITQVGAYASYQGRNIESDGGIVDESSNELNLMATSVTQLFEPHAQMSGTFTPVVKFGGTTQTMSTAAGFWWRYAENPDLIFFTIRIASPAAVSDVGNAVLEGLPFNSINDATQRFAATAWPTGMTGLTGAVSALVFNNDDTVGLYQSSATGDIPLTNSEFTTSSDIRVTGFYKRA